MCGHEEFPCCGCERDDLLTAEQAENMLADEDRAEAYFNGYDEYIADDDDSDEDEFASLTNLDEMEVEAQLCGDYGDN